VLSPNEPVFDALRGQTAPCEDFGPVLPKRDVEKRFMAVVDQARARFADVFGHTFSLSEEGIEQLELVVQEMWSSGWDPTKGDVDLFSTDFGSMLAVSIQHLLGGEFAFRSSTDLTHSSIWFEECRLETFPFHRIFKRLTHEHGESLTYYFRSLKNTINGSTPS